MDRSHFKTTQCHCVSMDSVVYTLPTQELRCTKCDRPTKGNVLLYSTNCALAPIEESMNDSRDILSSREDVLKVPCLCSHSILGKPEDTIAEPAALEMVVYSAGQGPGALPQQHKPLWHHQPSLHLPSLQLLFQVGY